jgi:hypothetical protein
LRPGVGAQKPANWVGAVSAPRPHVMLAQDAMLDEFGLLQFDKRMKDKQE